MPALSKQSVIAVAGIAQAIGLLQAAGVAVSRFSDMPGLIVMRSVAMLANEAADAVNQGLCNAQAANAAMRLGINYSLWPAGLGRSHGPAHHQPSAHQARLSLRRGPPSRFAADSTPRFCKEKFS